MAEKVPRLLPGVDFKKMKLDAMEIFNGVAQMDEHEVALVAEEREEDGLMGFGFVIGGSDGDFFKLGDGRGGDALVLGGGKCAPGFPVEAEELMKHGRAFDSEGDCRCFGHGWTLSVSRVRQGPWIRVQRTETKDSGIVIGN